MSGFFIRPKNLLDVLRRSFMVTIGLVVTASAIVTTFLPLTASAINFQDSMSLNDQAKSSSYYVTLKGCINSNMLPTIAATDAGDYGPLSVNWFDDNNAYGYVFSEGKMDCKQIMSNALTVWGMTPLQFLTALDYKKQSTTSFNYVTPNDGPTRQAKFESYVTTSLATSSPADISGAAAYKRYAVWWDANCVVQKFGIYSDIKDPTIKSRIDAGDYEGTASGGITTLYAKVTRTTEAAAETPYGYEYKYKVSATSRGGTSKSLVEYIAYGYHTTPRTITCQDTAAKLTQYAPDYVAYIKQQTVRTICSAVPYVNNPPQTTTLDACVAGWVNISNPTYCVNNYAQTATGYVGGTLIYDQVDELEACIAGSSITNAAILAGYTATAEEEGQDKAGTETPPSDATSCVVDSVGWIVCPLMNVLANLNDTVYSWIEGILVLNPLSQTMTDSTGAVVASPQYINWAVMRNIANVLLVIAFLFIIFSQISSVGISNYGVKKMLPRVILVAIAINLSWTIMSLAVDVVNIAGVGLQSLLSSAAIGPGANDIYTNVAQSALTGTAATIAGIGAAVIVITAPASTAAASTLVLLALPFILGAFLALLAAMITLFLRNAILIVLIIIAPVALAAYLLPNTEEYFKKWRKLLISMLFLFPIAALLFAGAKFAAYIILVSNQQYAQIIALFVMAAPLGLLPWLARSSGGIMATVGNKLGSFAKSGQGALQRGLQQRVETSRDERRLGRTNFLGQTRKAFRPLKGADGKPILDKHGNFTYGDPPKKKTYTQKRAEANEGLKLRSATAQKQLTANYKDIGLGSKVGEDGTQNRAQRQAARVASVVDRSSRADVHAAGVEQIYKGRFETAKLVPGEARDLYDRLTDAKTTTDSLEHDQTLRQKARIAGNDGNTAADAIGLSNLSNVQADSDGFIDDAQAERLQELGHGAANDPERGGGLKILHENQEAAEFHTEKIDKHLESEFEERKATGDLAGVKDEIDNAELSIEEQKAIQADRLAKRKGEAEAEGGLRETANRLSRTRETTAGREGRAKAIIDAAKAGIKDKDGNMFEIEGMDRTVQEDLAEAGREQSIAARQSALAAGIAPVLRAKEIHEENNTALAEDMAGLHLGLSDNTNLEIANAAKTTEADLEADKNTYRELHKNKSSTELFGAVLGTPDGKPNVIPTNIKTSDEMPLSEELAAIEGVVERGGAPDQDYLFNYSSALTLISQKAERDAAAAEASNPTSPAAIDARKKANNAKVRSRTIHAALQRAWRNSALKPMQYGGSVEQTFAEDTETRSSYEIQADRLGGGKYGIAIGNQPIDHLNALETQLKTYETDPTNLDRDFAGAFRIGAEFKASKLFTRGTPEWDAEVIHIMTEGLPEKRENLAKLVLQLDEALDDPNSPVKLSPEKNASFKRIRKMLVEKVLPANGIDLPGVPVIDPATQKPTPSIDPATGKERGPYRQRPAAEYNPQS